MENVRQPLFDVAKIGLQTTFQDLGRFGYQQYGVPVSGAMNRFSLQVANLLVGNARDEAGMEITMVGPELCAQSSMVIALCGADLRPEIDGVPVPMWKSFRIQPGDRLTFGAPKQGLRTYLAVASGFDIPKVMGSQSTYAKAGLGKSVEKDGRLYGFSGAGQPGVGLKQSQIPVYKKEQQLRVVAGPHTERFTEQGLDTFFNEMYTVSPQADRMGCRLDGATVAHRYRADIWSEAIPFGGVQVPANGKPIILMADRQTTGGYTRIGTVISVDLPKVAQLTPGDAVRFQAVGVNQAEALYREREHFFREIDSSNSDEIACWKMRDE